MWPGEVHDVEISANIGLGCDLLGNLAYEDSNDPPQGLGSPKRLLVCVESDG